MTATNSTTRSDRRALTLVELLVAMAIIAILLGVLVVGGKAVLNSQNRSNSKQQVMMIAAAIDKYASYWPAWEAFDAAGRTVKVADRGWPDYLPGRLFATGFPNSPYTNDFTGRFNVGVNSITFAVDNDSDFGYGFGGINESLTAGDQIIEGNVLNANICLAYALTAKTGDGPYLILNDDNAMLHDVAEKVTTYDPNYPRLNTGATTNLHNVSIAGRKVMLVDPWGTPYRYFWVYRNPNTPSGFAPVPTGDVTNAGFRTAVGYVLESAGPDRKFGNRWSEMVDTTPDDLDQAADNIIVQRP